ncbi:MAG: glycosyltransferase [Candidatus Acidiferrales bacterium]
MELLGPDRRDPRSRFDIVHAFHATKAGPRALRVAGQSGAALVVTLTGTDLNQDLQSSGRGSAVRRILERAAGLVVFSAASRAQLRRHSKLWAAKTRVIPAAVAPRFFACGVAHQG